MLLKMGVLIVLVLASFIFLGIKMSENIKQQEIKMKYLTKSGIENFIDVGDEAVGGDVATHFVDTLKDRIQRVRNTDTEVKEFVKKEKRRRRTKIADSDLSEFMQ